MLNTDSFGQWKQALMVYKFAIDEINTKLNIIDADFHLKNDTSLIEHIKTRIKMPQSIIDKLIRLDLEPTIENAQTHLFDIAGIRVVCSFADDIYFLYQMLLKHDDIEVIKVKDYIENPKPNGYRSLHLIVTVPVFLSDQTIKVPVEIQIRTVAMDFWASLEHKLNYKLNNDVPAHIGANLKVCAETSAMLDQQMQGIKRELDQKVLLNKES